jgi:hypothetical protein
MAFKLVKPPSPTVTAAAEFHGNRDISGTQNEISHPGIPDDNGHPDARREALLGRSVIVCAETRLIIRNSSNLRASSAIRRAFELPRCPARDARPFLC